MTIAERIVAEIVTDLADRRGLRQAWDAIDDSIRLEIIRAWEAIATHQLAPPRPRLYR